MKIKDKIFDREIVLFFYIYYVYIIKQNTNNKIECYIYIHIIILLIDYSKNMIYSTAYSCINPTYYLYNKSNNIKISKVLFIVLIIYISNIIKNITKY